MTRAPHRPPEELLARQVDYYRAIAPEYFHHALAESGSSELEAALEAHGPRGRVLEIACGPGTWTGLLADRADSLTAIDASPEMLAIAAERVRAPHVRFERADVFRWRPEERYDGVFFGFWISHVPPARFAEFWETVAACLEDRGRVMFCDDSHRTREELVEGEGSPVAERRLRDGSAHRIFKVPYDPPGLEGRLAELGWAIGVHPTSGPFYWGEGGRADAIRAPGAGSQLASRGA